VSAYPDFPIFDRWQCAVFILELVTSLLHTNPPADAAEVILQHYLLAVDLRHERPIVDWCGLA
jgi:hypothetical protein